MKSEKNKIDPKWSSTGVALSFLFAALIFSGCGLAVNQIPFAPSSQSGGIRFSETTASESSTSRSESLPGSYLVVFRTSEEPTAKYFSSFIDEYAYHYENLSHDYLSDPSIKSIDVLSQVDLTPLRSPEWEPEFSKPSNLGAWGDGIQNHASAGVMARVDFVSEVAARKLLVEWEQSGRIWFAEPNEVSRLDQGELATWSGQYSSLQSWHRMIKISEAFASLTDSQKTPGALPESDLLSSGAVIAVLDSGVDYEHPLLKDNIWTNSAVGAAGCADDVHGCNTTAPSKGYLGNGDVWPVNAEGPGVSCTNSGGSDQCDHGTHVAGILAAKPDSLSLVGGVCPMCKVMVLRVTAVEPGDTSANPLIRDDSQIRAFKYLTRFRRSGGSAVRIVNASFGKYSKSRSLAILVDVLKNVGSGTLVIGAASNDDSMIRSYPAALANAIAVASVGTESDAGSPQKSSFSNYGPWVDISAPGMSINSTVSGGSQDIKAGTSMAAPVVCGAAGLLLSAYPNLSFGQLRDRIINSADATLLYGADTDGGKLNLQYYYPKIAGELGRRPLLGSGILDVNGMVRGATGTSIGQPLDRVMAGCGVIGMGLERIPGNPLFVLCLILPIFFGWLFRRKG